MNSVPEGTATMVQDGLRVTILKDQPFLSPKDYSHKYGGSSTFVRDIANCSICKKPYRLLFEFDLSDPRLRFLSIESPFLAVLSCFDCDTSWAGPMFYRFPAGRMEVLKHEGSRWFEDWSTACPERSILIAPIPHEQRPDAFPSIEAWFDQMLKLDVSKHQLGGMPFWIQDEEELSCIECGLPMRWIGQVDSEAWPIQPESRTLAGHMFADMGILGIWWCDACHIVGTSSQFF